jgi:Zn-dependent protease
MNIDWNLVIAAVILVASTMVHEVAHGIMADRLGDPTPRAAHRLTANPIRHIDYIGSIVVPGIMVFLRSGFIFGWAKPVPFEPKYFSSQRWGSLMVGIVGPLTNFVIALSVGVVIRYAYVLGIHNSFVLGLLAMVVVLNLVLGIFNFIPIPPLDGSHLLFGIFGGEETWFAKGIRKIWPLLFIGMMVLLWKNMTPMVEVLYGLVVGA